MIYAKKIIMDEHVTYYRSFISICKMQKRSVSLRETNVEVGMVGNINKVLVNVPLRLVVPGPASIIVLSQALKLVSYQMEPYQIITLGYVPAKLTVPFCDKSDNFITKRIKCDVKHIL